MDANQLHHLSRVTTSTETAWSNAARSTLSDLTVILTSLHSLHALQSPHHARVPVGTTTDALSAIEGAHARLKTAQRRLRTSLAGVQRWLFNLPPAIDRVATQYMHELRRELDEKTAVLVQIEVAMAGGSLPNYEIVVAKWAEVNRRVSGFDLAAVIEAHQLLQTAIVPSQVVRTPVSKSSKVTSPALAALLEK